MKSVAYIVSLSMLVFAVGLMSPIGKVNACGTCLSSWYWDGYTAPDGADTCHTAGIPNSTKYTKDYKYKMTCDLYSLDGLTKSFTEPAQTGGINQGNEFDPYHQCPQHDVTRDCNTQLTAHGIIKTISMKFDITHNHAH